jgi:hypothetical protein
MTSQNEVSGCTDSHIRRTRRKNSRMQHAFALRCYCGIYLLNDSFGLHGSAASSAACVRGVHASRDSKPREMFGTAIWTAVRPIARPPHIHTHTHTHTHTQQNRNRRWQAGMHRYIHTCIHTRTVNINTGVLINT